MSLHTIRMFPVSAALLIAVAMVLAVPAYAQNACNKTNCKITITTGAGSPILKGCGPGADIGRLEVTFSSPNGMSGIGDFNAAPLLQLETAQAGYPIPNRKLEFRTRLNNSNSWQDVLITDIIVVISVGATLDVPEVVEVRAKAGARIGDPTSNPSQSRTMEILKMSATTSFSGIFSLESRHQPLFFIGGEGCGQWARGHGHVYDENGKRVR